MKRETSQPDPLVRDRNGLLLPASLARKLEASPNSAAAKRALPIDWTAIEDQGAKE